MTTNDLIAILRIMETADGHCASGLMRDFVEQFPSEDWGGAMEILRRGPRRAIVTAETLESAIEEAAKMAVN